MQSRLARRSVKQSKNQLYISLAGIVVVLFLAINFGPSVIGGAGNIIDKITGKSGLDAIVKSNGQVQPPTLDPLPQATPSATINISGKTDYPNGNVELFVNNSLSDQTKVETNQTFNFKEVNLTSGNNAIKVRMVINDQKSDFSGEEDVMYTKNAPKLDISNPQDKQNFTKADQQIVVNGTTDPDSSVRVNGFVAIVDNQGNFSYNLGLNQGDNKIAIVATGASGQTTEKDLTVSYSP